MHIFFNFETLSFIGFFLIMFIISFFMFNSKKYKNNNLQIVMYQKYFFLLLLFYLFISTLFIPFNSYLHSSNILIFSFGLIIGAIFVLVSSRHYIHDGLLVIGMITTLILIFIFQVYENSFESIWAAFIFGIIGSFILLPLYGNLITSSSQSTTVAATIVLISVIFIFIALQEDSFISARQWVYYIVLGILCIAVILDFFFRYKYILTWFLWLMGERLITLRYKIIYQGTEHLSDEKAFLILSNHVSWLDWMILQFPLKRRVHYMINKKMYDKWYLNPFIRINECIPISKHASKEGFSNAKKFLQQKHIIGVFPEGSISKTGELGRFYPGFELINEPIDAKILPVYISGLWGSIFSRSKKKFCSEKDGFRRVIRVQFGAHLPLNTKAVEVKKSIQQIKNKDIDTSTKKDSVLITLHGIRTYGIWQKKLRKVVDENTSNFLHYSMNYGFVGFFCVFFRFSRKKILQDALNDIEKIINQNNEKDIHIIAHSFGTYIIVKFLASKKLDKKIKTLILAASVLPVDYFDKVDLTPNVERLINDSGDKDNMLIINKIITNEFGDSGRIGLNIKNNSYISNRYFKGKHKLYFNTKFYEEFWLPYLLPDRDMKT